jgi:hypothetical protein
MKKKDILQTCYDALKAKYPEEDIRLGEEAITFFKDPNNPHTATVMTFTTGHRIIQSAIKKPTTGGRKK